MKKSMSIIVMLIVAFTSFGFILFKNSEKETFSELESTNQPVISEELSVENDFNDDQWD